MVGMARLLGRTFEKERHERLFGRAGLGPRFPIAGYGRHTHEQASASISLTEPFLVHMAPRTCASIPRLQIGFVQVRIYPQQYRSDHVKAVDGIATDNV